MYTSPLLKVIVTYTKVAYSKSFCSRDLFIFLNLCALIPYALFLTLNRTPFVFWSLGGVTILKAWSLLFPSVWPQTAFRYALTRRSRARAHQCPFGVPAPHYPWVPSQAPSAQESEDLRKRRLAITTAPALAKRLYSFSETTDFKRLDAKHSSAAAPGLFISPQSWARAHFSQAFDQILIVK